MIAGFWVEEFDIGKTMIDTLIDMLTDLFIDEDVEIRFTQLVSYDRFTYYPCVIDTPEKPDPQHSNFWLELLTPEITTRDIVRINARKLPDSFL